MRGIRLANLVTQHRCNDVPHNVPGRIHVLSRGRALAQGLAAVKPEQQLRSAATAAATAASL